MPCAILLFFTTLVLYGCGLDAKKQSDTLVSDYDVTEMDAAIQKSRETLHVFLAVLASGNADSFSVKAPISDKNGTEHFWITDIAYEDGLFTGMIGNEPGIVESVSYGQKWEVRENAISDWLFMRDGKIHGGCTIDPLLGDSSEDQELRSLLVR